jgi:hypothetical protein
MSLSAKESYELRIMAYVFPSMPGRIHLELSKQRLAQVAMRAYWPLRIAGLDYLLAPVILWAATD